MTQNKIYIIGETTFDIIFKNDAPSDGKVGGSQLNTAVSLGRLGLPVSFISQVGSDSIGNISETFLKKNDINTQYLRRFEGNSRIALAFLDNNNNAEYSFYNGDNNSPTIPELSIQANDFVLFGSSYALRQDIRPQLLNLLKTAKSKKATILYDPNFRKSQLKNLEQLLPIYRENIAFADIIKGSDEDFESMFGTSTANDTFEKIAPQKDKVLVYTANKNGVGICNAKGSWHFEVPKITPVSTIGAGDTFNAGILHTLYTKEISNKEISNLDKDFWTFMVENATLFAQHVCMSKDNYISQELAHKYK